MGCGPSKQQNGAQQPPARQACRNQGTPMTIGAPTEVSIHIPRNRIDQHGAPRRRTTHEIERPDLENALGLMASYLNRKDQRLTVIAVGGAVNTLLLRTRNATHDVDVFGTNLDNQARVSLDEAMEYAIRNSRPPLGTDWFNTETQMWLSPSLHKELTQQAIRQNVVVFERPGLRVLAAPWEYAFSAKVARLLTGGEQVRPYDLSDAIHYLNIFVKRHGGKPVPIAMVEDWAKRFHHPTNRNFLKARVNAEYRKKFGRDGIT